MPAHQEQPKKPQTASWEVLMKVQPMLKQLMPRTAGAAAAAGQHGGGQLEVRQLQTQELGCCCRAQVRGLPDVFTVRM